MKAKEYAENFLKIREENNGDDVKGIVEILKQLNLETKNILIERKVKTDSAKLAVFVEQNNKWKAICRIVNRKIGDSLNPNGYNAVGATDAGSLEELLHKTLEKRVS